MTATEKGHLVPQNLSMRLFRWVDGWRARLQYSWSLRRLRAAGVQLGEEPALMGSVLVGYGPGITLGNYVRLGDGVYLGTFPGGELIIGDNTYLGKGTIILAYERVVIGRDCELAPYTYITDVNHGFHRGELIRKQPLSPEPVAIEDDVWFGSFVKVMPGVRIGRGAVVGAGAVVTRDVEPDTVVVGVPAHAIGERPEFDESIPHTRA